MPILSKDDYSIIVVEGAEIVDDTVHELRKGEIEIPSNDNRDLYLTNEILSKHCLMLGSIGSGKSNLMFHVVDRIRSHMTDEDCIVFFDSKGDYLEKFCTPQDVIIGNSGWVQTHFLDMIQSKRIQFWNVFSDLSTNSSLLEMIREVSTSLFKKSIDNAQNPIFPRGARDMFAAVLYSLIKKSTLKIGKGRYVNLDGKEVLLDNSSIKMFFEGFSIERFSKLIDGIDEVEWVKTYISSGAKTNTTQSYLTYLNAIPHEVFTNDFGEAGSFSIKDFINGGKRRGLFLEYDIVNSNTIDVIYTVLLDIAMKEALGKKRKGNIYFILDEFPLIPQLTYFDNLLNFGRQLGVKVIAGIQNVGQVYAKYDLYLGNSILSGFSTYFAFSLFDQSSRDIVKLRHGKNRSICAVKRYGIEGYDIEVQEADVIPDWRLTSLDNGQCIVSVPGFDPFQFKSTKFGENSTGKIKIKRK